MMLFKSSHQVAFLGASLLAISSSSAFDADCGEGYTGYSLKLGTQCRSYVYCSAGRVSSTTECPGSLIYDGNVGVGGVCGWPNTVTCADAGGGAATSSGEPASSVSVSVNVDTDEADTLAQLLKIDSSPSPPSPSANSFIIAAPTPPTTTIGSPTSMSLAIDLTSRDTGFCGGSKADAEAKCVPCVDRMCNDLTEACWMGTSCSSSNVSQPTPSTTTTYSLQSPPSSTSYVTSPSASTASESTLVEAATVPTVSPSLPPWTNAPFTPYNGPRRDKTVIGYYARYE